jgi:GNAT superfamily N-acetyltransferase
VHIPTCTIIGAAAWADPSLPVHNPFRRDSIAFYGLQERMGWSDADIDELFAHVDDVAWNGNLANYDEVRSKFFGGEKHWYLASLFTWPGWQGRGVAKKLLSWAIEKADAKSPPTPIYLETSPPARAVYMHVGFVPHGESGMCRRGPKVVKALEAENE